MLENMYYKNGNKIHELINNHLTYFYKSGTIKAQGNYINDLMEGAWKFYHEDGSLWQEGTFLHGQKHGYWTRYNKDNIVEYHELFNNNKTVKKRKE